MEKKANETSEVRRHEKIKIGAEFNHKTIAGG